MKPEPRFDVVIYEVTTRKVTNVVGTDLLSESSPGHGFHTVEKRLDTVAARLNDHFDVKAVSAGTVKVDSILPL